jgi:hypothetical protein
MVLRSNGHEEAVLVWGFLLRCAAFGLVAFLAAEIVLRTVVPASQPPFQTQDQEYGILGLEGSPSREGLYTVGRLARDRARWRINDAGWNSAIEYVPRADRERPCVAVVGNSYVEGFYADVDSGLTAALQSELQSRYDVYNFGKSGVVAAQMVRVARYAQERFAPQTFVFVLNNESLRSSVRDFGYVIFNAQYRSDGDELVEIPPERYTPNKLMRLHTYSAVARYLYQNAAALRTRAAIRQQAVQRNDAQAVAQVADERPLLEAAALKVVRTIRAEHPEAVVLFIIDADRRTMYETGAEPAPLRESPIWAAACAQQGCGYLDLTTAFWDAYRTDRRRLDFAGNYHWNRRGMTVVAKAIAQWLRQVPGALPAD